MSILMTASVFAAAFLIVSTVCGAPVPKTMGNATLYWGDTLMRVTVKFSAFQTTPDDAGDRGTFNFSLEDGRYFELDVIHVKVRTQDSAAFAGSVTSANYPGTGITPGLWVVVWSYDGDEPGAGRDRLHYEIAGESQEKAIEMANTMAVLKWDGIVDNGNINVSLPISETPDG